MIPFERRGPRVLVDGAIGTELHRRGVPLGAALDLAAVERPSLVEALHEEYREAGAGILTTHTFSANPFRLAQQGIEDRLRQINTSAVHVARGAARGALIAGSIGPSGLDRLPDVRTLRRGFGTQARVLEETGVDIFICETFLDVGELEVAVRGVRDVSNRPIVALTSWTDRLDPRIQAREVAVRLPAAGADAIGVNCASGLEATRCMLEVMHDACDLPLAAIPNAGAPVTTLEGLQYPVGADEFAMALRDLAKWASIVGGCCGTTPEHIRAAQQQLSQ